MSEMTSMLMETDKKFGSGIFTLSLDERQLKYGSLKRILDAVNAEQLDTLKRYTDTLQAFFTHTNTPAYMTDDERTKVVLLKTTLFAEAEHYADCLICFSDDMARESQELEGERLLQWRSEQAACHDVVLKVCGKISEMVESIPDYPQEQRTILQTLAAIDREGGSVIFNKFLLLLAYSDVVSGNMDR